MVQYTKVFAGLPDVFRKFRYFLKQSKRRKETHGILRMIGKLCLSANEKKLRLFSPVLGGKRSELSIIRAIPGLQVITDDLSKSPNLFHGIREVQRSQ